MLVFKTALASRVILHCCVFLTLSGWAFGGLLCNKKYSCDATHFNDYYGLQFNHFDFAAFQDTSGIPHPPFYAAVLQTGLMQTQSFFMYSCKGCGKSSIQHWRVKQIPPKSFYFAFDTQFVQDAIDNFAEQCPTQSSADCLLEHWTDKDFTELLLSGLVTQVVTDYGRQYPRIDPANAEKLLNREDRLDLIKMFTYFSNSASTTELEDVIDDLFGQELGTHRFFAKNPKLKAQGVNIQEYDEKNRRFVDKEGFSKIHSISARSKVVRPVRIEHNRLLLGLLDLLQETNQCNTVDDAANYMRLFSKFLRSVYGMPIVVSLDGLDENVHFFNGELVREEALRKFILSSTSQEVLALLMANPPVLTVFFFYPTIKSLTLVDFNQRIGRSDKFEPLTVDWTAQQLINYAEFYFEDMRAHSNSFCKCKQLPAFKSFLPVTEVEEMWATIENPRELNAIIRQLIIILQEKAPSTACDLRFLADKNDFTRAYEKAKKSFLPRQEQKKEVPPRFQQEKAEL